MLQSIEKVIAVLLLTVCFANGQKPTCGCCPSQECQANPTPCSTNPDCACLLMTITSGGMCANTIISCRDMVPCESDNMTCSVPNTVCVNNTRCKVPVCYPIELASAERCPPMTSNITKPLTSTTTALPTTVSTREPTTSTISTTLTTTLSPTSTACLGCSNSSRTVLLLSDTYNSSVQALIDSLRNAGLTVNSIYDGIATYGGSPDASTYSAVVLINANDYSKDMNVNGQQSIVNAQTNYGTGVVLTEWAAHMKSISLWQTLSQLLLATRITGYSTNMSYSLNSDGHPIWNGLPRTFNTSFFLGYSTLNISANGCVTVATSMPNYGPAVIVRPNVGSKGRIVQINHAGHYYPSIFNWNNDANLLNMMINAVKWAAKII